MILRGEAPPAAWVPSIRRLDFFGERRFANAEPLKGLVNLTALWLENTPIRDVSPLRNLPRLARIDVESRKRAKALLPQLGAGWTVKRKAKHESWYELRRDVSRVRV